jgi:hypothetical protein
MKVTVYGMIFKGAPSRALRLSWFPHLPNQQLTVGDGDAAITYHADTSLSWDIEAPEGSKMEKDIGGQDVLFCEYQGRRYKLTATQVYDFAPEGHLGFTFVNTLA